MERIPAGLGELRLILAALKKETSLLDCIMRKSGTDDLCEMAQAVAHVNMALELYPNKRATSEMNQCITILAGRALRELCCGEDGKADVNVLARNLFDKKAMKKVFPGDYLGSEGQEEAALTILTAAVYVRPDLIKQLAGFVKGKPHIVPLARLVPVFGAARLSPEPMTTQELAFTALGEGSETVAHIIASLMDAALPKGSSASAPADEGAAPL